MTALSFLRLQPDMGRLSRWARSSGLRDAAADPGYAVHAATRAALGDLAPKPFALRQRAGATELVGYVAASAEHLARACALDAHDPEAAAVLGLHDRVVKPMPTDWRVGERFSFELRAAPIVRSRAAAPGRYVEIDAAFHPDYATDAGDRATAYGAWLRTQLGRQGGAELVSHETVTFQLADMVRRTQAAGMRSKGADRAEHAGHAGHPEHADGNGNRRSRHGLLPDLTVRGELRVVDGPAIAGLLARGLGRHRSFGFGCLLLAPPGAFHRSGG